MFRNTRLERMLFCCLVFIFLARGVSSEALQETKSVWYHNLRVSAAYDYTFSMLKNETFKMDFLNGLDWVFEGTSGFRTDIAYHLNNGFLFGVTSGLSGLKFSHNSLLDSIRVIPLHVYAGYQWRLFSSFVSIEPHLAFGYTFSSILNARLNILNALNRVNGADIEISSLSAAASLRVGIHPLSWLDIFTEWGMHIVFYNDEILPYPGFQVGVAIYPFRISPRRKKALTVTPDPIIEAPSSNLLTHVVSEGDTFSVIAEKYLGNYIYWPYLFYLQRKAFFDPDVLSIGDVITISPLPTDASAGNPVMRKAFQFAYNQYQQLALTDPPEIQVERMYRIRMLEEYGFEYLDIPKEENADTF